MSPLLVLFASISLTPTSIELARGGLTTHKIVVAAGASVQTRAAADELAFHLHRITDANFSVVTDAAAQPEEAIHVGGNRFLT